MNKFWNFKTENDGTRTLYLCGSIADESWFDDDVTPKAFRAELEAGQGDIVVWINSPGGDCVAAAQIYNMLMDYKGNVKIDIGDKNIKSDVSDKIEISCCFRIDDDAKIIIDTSVPVDLREEYLLNGDNELEIKKVWDCSKKTIGAKDLKIFIKAKYPILECGSLVGEKLSVLKSILKTSVDEDAYNAVDKTKSSEIRKAIYSAQVDANTVFAVTEVDVSAEGMKDIWKSLQGSLPLYFLFKSDRVNSDKDDEVQTPMKVVTKTVIAERQAEVDSIINTVREKIEFIGKETLEKLSDLDPEIAKKLSPEVHTRSLDSILLLI